MDRFHCKMVTSIVSHLSTSLDKHFSLIKNLYVMNLKCFYSAGPWWVFVQLLKVKITIEVHKLLEADLKHQHLFHSMAPPLKCWKNKMFLALVSYKTRGIVIHILAYIYHTFKAIVVPYRGYPWTSWVLQNTKQRKLIISKSPASLYYKTFLFL